MSEPYAQNVNPPSRPLSHSQSPRVMPEQR